MVPNLPGMVVGEPPNSSIVPTCRMSTMLSIVPNSGDSACSSHCPVRFRHGLTGVPPPQAPAVHVSPVVHTLRSSQAAPSGDGVQTDGSPVQVKHGSIWQRASQPSPLTVLPSKHSHRSPPADDAVGGEHVDPTTAPVLTNRTSPTMSPPRPYRHVDTEPEVARKVPAAESMVPVRTIAPAVMERLEPDWTKSTGFAMPGPRSHFPVTSRAAAGVPPTTPQIGARRRPSRSERRTTF